jgi:hypothetical protein
LTDKLLEACTDYPYLLVHAYNVLARFQLENVAGQLLAQVGIKLFPLFIPPIPYLMELLTSIGFLMFLFHSALQSLH